MKVGWIGLGKLGLPCALVCAGAGHEVHGTDANVTVRDYLASGTIPYEEAGVDEAFARGLNVEWHESIGEVVRASDLVFVAVQTPHAPQYEGCNLTPDSKRDFDYTALESAVRSAVDAVSKPTVIVVVSTVNPGTCSRILNPIFDANPLAQFVYSPAFIAMGTTMADFSSPEMVIAGSSSPLALDLLEELHKSIHDAPFLRLSIIGCEMTKMTYNTFIGFKIVFANLIAEVCEKLGGDADEVTNALAQANHRIISSKYLRAGMGDGGGCHPRDQLALSWLSERLNLSVDLFDFLMRARDGQTSWQAEELISLAEVWGLPIRICGAEYKAESNLTVGSPSRLLMSILGSRAQWQDQSPTEPAIYFVAVNHSKYLDWQWPAGSVVVDPWGFLSPQPGMVLKTPGRRHVP